MCYSKEELKLSVTHHISFKLFSIDIIMEGCVDFSLKSDALNVTLIFGSENHVS
jgi:hypothetical protein